MNKKSYCSEADNPEIYDIDKCVVVWFVCHVVPYAERNVTH